MQQEDKIQGLPVPTISSASPEGSSSPSWCAKKEFEDITCWKTNLMLKEEQERVRERSEIFRRRTSFEDNLINQHISAMLKAVTSTDLKIKTIPLPKSDLPFTHLKTSQQIPQLTSNYYLTQYEKWQYTSLILSNQQNFSIMVRLSTVLDQNQQELIYLLAKILCFCTSEMESPVKYNTTQEVILELVDQNRLKLMNQISNQQVIKVVNPIFFSNVNEQPLMKIIDSWFYHVLCIKQGLYVGDIEEEGEETHFQQENFFID